MFFKIEHDHCTLLVFPALQHLAKCSELRILKLGLCSSISDRGIAFISSNCGKLVELDLYR
jgi:F-box and leucine-rich repeat protein 2/20